MKISALKDLNKAFTLIELMVYTALSSIILTMILTFTVTVVDGSTRINANVEIYHNNKFTINRIKLDIEEADQINIAQSVFDVNSSVLVLQHDLDTIKYSLNGNQLTRQFNAILPINLLTRFVKVNRFVVNNRFQPSGIKSINVLLDTAMVNVNNRPELKVSQVLETNVLLRN